LRILIVNNFAFVTGGADLHCLQLAEGLRARGHEVELLATADPMNRDHHGAFVPAIVTNTSRGQLGAVAALNVALQALWNPSAARATRSVIERFRPDVAHLHKLYVQLSVSPVVTAARHRVPLLQTVHDYEFTAASSTDATGGWIDRVEPKASYRLLNTLLYVLKRTVHRPRVSEWISVSRSTAAIYEANGINTTVLPNFTLSPFAPRRLPAFTERTGLLYVGRLSEEKGILDVLELARQMPRLPIRLAGGGPLQGLVTETAQRHSNLEYLGNLEPKGVAAELLRARIAIMPSLWREPGPLAALEAMAHGVPIIAYANGGLAEYVADAGAGIVIDPSAVRLARAAGELYENEERWLELAQRGPEAVKTTHSFERYLDKLEEIYARLAQVTSATTNDPREGGRR
jgi:glycosyltransferase involved in cell wall biosynthesis